MVVGATKDGGLPRRYGVIPLSNPDFTTDILICSLRAQSGRSVSKASDNVQSATDQCEAPIFK